MSEKNVKRVNLQLNMDDPFQAELENLFSLAGCRKMSKLAGILAHEFLKDIDVPLTETNVKDFIQHYEALSLLKSRTSSVSSTGYSAPPVTRVAEEPVKESVSAKPKVSEEALKAMGAFCL